MFKIGDKVRVVDAHNGVGEFKGTEKGTIVKITGGSNDYWRLNNCNEWVWKNSQIKLVADGPIRTVTKREIVPGEYARFGVVLEGPELRLSIGKLGHSAAFTARELREAAELFNQLAEVLEDA